MCGQCQARFEKNPLRILDCKEEKCKAITANAPKILDYLCDDCKAHFEKVQAILTSLGIPFKVNSGIVRGLDYYTRTVFEFVSTDIGAQGTVCGGGRYNNLVEEVGGKPTPAVGFGMGLERLLLVLENTNNLQAEPETIDVYVASLGEEAQNQARKIVAQLRSEGIKAETDIMDRGIKAQMKYADRVGAKYVVVIGDEELENGVVNIKNMQNGETQSHSIENLAGYFAK